MLRLFGHLPQVTSALAATVAELEGLCGGLWTALPRVRGIGWMSVTYQHTPTGGVASVEMNLKTAKVGSGL